MLHMPPRNSAVHPKLASSWPSLLLCLTTLLATWPTFVSASPRSASPLELTIGRGTLVMSAPYAALSAKPARVVSMGLGFSPEIRLLSESRWARFSDSEATAAVDVPVAWFQARLESAERASEKDAAGPRKRRDEAWEQEVNETAQDELARMPWYDRQSDQVQPLPVRPPRDLQNRLSRWESGPEVNSTWDWQIPAFLSPILEALAWLALLTFLLVIAYLLVRAFMDSDFISPRSGTWAQQELDGEADRVEALPVQLKRPQGDLLAEARRHYEAGEWDEAMIYLYSYQLVQLDKGQLIRLTRGKTNRQYLRELARNRGPVELMTQSVMAFEDVFFGRHPLGRQRFEACWNRLEEFQRAVATEPVNA